MSPGPVFCYMGKAPPGVEWKRLDYYHVSLRQTPSSAFGALSTEFGSPPRRS